MPNCRECKYLSVNGGQAQCLAAKSAEEELKRPVPPPPSGACMIPILENYMSLFKPGQSVLEIGCGSWPKLRDACVRAGAHYEGIDTKDEYYGQKSVATRLENLADLSFPNETFDFVVGNQTMEHWGEFGCSLDWGLWQCFRVLKPGGYLLMNVPVHFHGTKPFLLGDMATIKRRLKKYASEVVLEPWGQNTDPIPPLFVHPDYKVLAHKSAYVLDIRAQKAQGPFTAVSHKKRITGRLGRWLEYPMSYNVYRWKYQIRRKLGGDVGSQHVGE